MGNISFKSIWVKFSNMILGSQTRLGWERILRTGFLGSLIGWFNHDDEHSEGDTTVMDVMRIWATSVAII